jgi:hypothetical protein
MFLPLSFNTHRSALISAILKPSVNVASSALHVGFAQTQRIQASDPFRLLRSETHMPGKVGNKGRTEGYGRERKYEPSYICI